MFVTVYLYLDLVIFMYTSMFVMFVRLLDTLLYVLFVCMAMSCTLLKSKKKIMLCYLCRWMFTDHDVACSSHVSHRNNNSWAMWPGSNLNQSPETLEVEN